jgi:prepilin-type processing-associated H-X9-DG protein
MLSLAEIMYAQENKDYLPPDSGANQVWDMDYTNADAIAADGAPYKIWYDPGTYQTYSDTDYQDLWYDSLSESPSGKPYRIVGYAGTFSGIGEYANGVIYPIQASSRILLACVTIADEGSYSTVPAIMNTFTWTGIPSSEDGDVVVTKPFTSAHMNRKLPSGDNVGMFDGHVEWRPFRQIVPRAGGGGPSFYY